MPLDDLEEIRRILHRSWVSAGHHAASRGFDCLLSEEFVEDLYKRQHGRCAITGVKFSLEPSFPKALVKHPFAPSIDRRLSDRGYTEDNVRLVCVAVNFGMGQWGEETYLTLAYEAVSCDQNKGIKIEDKTKWRAAVRERLGAAEKILPLLAPGRQKRQRRRIAAFKAALSRGRAEMSRGADKAWEAIRSRQT